eukprot:SM000001S04799  [mRNA]  locus=s1:2202731:2203664:- [translate_table: standard]
MPPRKSGTAAKAGGLLALAGGAVVGLWYARPRDPLFEVVDVALRGFSMRWCTDSPLILAVVDVELTLAIRVVNRNVVPITYADTTMDIFYRGQLLGQAQVPSGGQGARSEHVMELPCKLDGLEISSHMLALLSDVAARKMTIHSLVTISGEARLLFLRHTFKIYVDSDLDIDPVMLNVLDQENRVSLELGKVKIDKG